MTILGFLTAVAVSQAFGFSNEPDPNAPGFDQPFDQATPPGWDAFCCLNIVSDDTTPGSPGHFFRSTYRQGLQAGVSPTQTWRPFPSNTREVFVGYWIRVSSSIDNNDAGTKTLFIFGDGPDASHIVPMIQGNDPGPYHWEIYFPNGVASNQHLEASDGDAVGTRHIGPNIQTVEVTLGEWMKVEVYVKMSSSLTRGDGVMAMWVNDTLTIYHDDVNFPQAPWVMVDVSNTWGGNGGPTVAFDWHMDFDHIHASFPNGAPLPPPPPSNCGNGACDHGESTASCPSDCPVNPPPPSSSMGQVADLSAAVGPDGKVTVQFTEVNDGAGAPAHYQLRWATPSISWGTVPSTQMRNISGAQIGAQRAEIFTDLLPNTRYEFQLVPYSGVLEVNALFGGLSNVAGVTTAAVVVPPPDPNPNANEAPIDGEGSVTCTPNGEGQLECDGAATVRGCAAVEPISLFTLTLVSALLRRRMQIQKSDFPT